MDIVQNIQIAAAPADVAAVMFDPAREREWMTSVTSTTPRTAGITVGAEVDRTSVVAGQQVSWATQVSGFHFPHVLRLRITGGQGGSLNYEVQRAGSGSVAVVRAASDVDLFGFDLPRLKAIVERGMGA
jgi:carbon monoxide dehydrogenase subunit G